MLTMDYIGIPLSTLIPVLILGGLVGYLLYYKNRKYTFPKGPRPIPLLGNLHQLLSIPAHLKLSQWAYDYGPIYKVNFGTFPALVVNDVKIMKELFSIYPTSTGKFNTDTFMLPFEGFYGFGCTSGQKWQEQRQFCVKSLRNLGLGKGSQMESILSHESDQLLASCLEALREGSFHLPNLFRRSTFNTILVLVTGETIAPDDNEFSEIMTNLMEALDQSVKTGLAFLPWLKHIFPKQSGYESMEKASMAVNKYVRECFKRHNLKSNTSTGDCETLLAAYTDKLQAEVNPDSTFYGDEGWKHCLGSIITIFVAGGETTSTSLEWMIFYLVAHPDIQSKLQNEIDEVVGTRNVSVADKLKMPYTETVILETLRKSSILPLGIIHELTEDLKFHQYSFPKGAMLIANLFHVHHNVSVWKDPENFRPERFLEDPGLKEYIAPFQLGRRQCMAEHLAKDILFLFIVKLLQKFTFEPDPTVKDRREYLEPGVGFTLLPKKLPVRAIVRE